MPTRPDPGFGYICPGSRGRTATVCWAVQRFVEKPDRAAAGSRWCATATCGTQRIFVWRAWAISWRKSIGYTPEVSGALAAGARGRRTNDADGLFQRGAARAAEVDVRVLERSRPRPRDGGRSFGWDDVGHVGGTCGGFRRRWQTPDSGSVHGPVSTRDARDNVVHAESGTVVLYGVSDLVVVTRDGLTLVTTVDRSNELKTLVESLPARVGRAFGMGAGIAHVAVPSRRRI